MFRKPYKFTALLAMSAGIVNLLAVDIGRADTPETRNQPKITKDDLRLKNYHGEIHVQKLNSDESFKHEAETESTKEGRRLYEKFKCAECHQIDHHGGYAAPSLDNVGASGRDYVFAHINNPQAEAVKKDKFFELLPTSMPRYSISPEQAKKICDFLMTLPSREH